jgi:hypothetical protein
MAEGVELISNILHSTDGTANRGRLKSRSPNPSAAVRAHANMGSLSEVW